MGWLRRYGEALLLGVSLAIIAGASLVLYRSLEDDRAAERARQERFMRNAAFSVVDDLGGELFALVSTFSYDLNIYRETGGTVDQNVLTDTVHRYQSLARFPDLLQNLACLEWTRDGTWTYAEWRPSGWTTGPAPAWAADLTIPKPTPETSPPPPSRLFSLEKPVILLRLGRVPHPVPGQVVAVALRFSPQVILDKVVPLLVRQRFAESQDALPYRATVHNTELEGALPEPSPDWEEPLLPWTPFEGWFDYYLNRLKTLDKSRLAFERAAPRPSLSEDLGTGWSLRVYRLPGGLDAEMSGLRIRNIGYAVSFFLVLVLGVLSFYWIAVRARSRAAQERTFLALVSHELKTPLAVVRSLAENLAGGLANDGDRPREYGAVMVEEAERLSRMVGNVLALSAVQGGLSPGELSAVDLGEVVRDRLSRESPGTAGIDLQARLHPGLPLVRAQPAALRATVDNLIGNAFRHGARGEGSRIVVVVEPRVRWGRRGVELLVEDDGPGFTFWEGLSFRRPFRRGSRAWSDQTPGGGLGLSLARTTARALGGHLSWTSRPGHTTRFVLWLREANR
jgi:signal transduction histidine kinase